MNILPLIIIVLIAVFAYSAWKNGWDWKAGAVAIGASLVAAYEAFKGAL
jgi:hypothetical protein